MDNMSIKAFPIHLYDCQERLGKGGFGTVHRYQLKQDQASDGPKEVAVKVFEVEKNLKREIENLQRVASSGTFPNIVPCLGKCQVGLNNDFGFVMPIFDMDLLHYVLKTDYVPERNAIWNIAIQLAKALDDLQRLCIVHRDIKPDNVLIRKHSSHLEVAITDLGISRQIERTQATITADKGTDLWKAPEVPKFKDDDRTKSTYGHPADIFGYGLILEFLQTKQFPLGSTAKEQDLANWIDQLPIEDDVMFDLIKKCLKFLPEKRIRKDQLLTHEWFKNDMLIPVVGTTGTGKSSLISIMTGLGNLASGSGASSVTKQCQLVVNARKSQGSPIWMDSMGWDDTDGNEDTETFRQILKQLDGKKLSKVAALIWAVSPEERSSQRLKRQAEFINQFKEKDVWKNVIIVCKQPMGWNLARACQGALEAAKQVSGTDCANVRLVGLSIQELMEDNFESLDQDRKDQFFIVSKAEAIEKMEEILENVIQDPIQVIFQDAECTACGVLGDKRLLPDFCHLIEELVHPKEMRPFHPKELVSYHAGRLNPVHTQRMVAFHSQGLVTYHPGQLKQVHSGGTYSKRMANPDAAIRGWLGRDVLGNAIRVTLCSTCHRELDTRGCCKEYTCCSGGEYSNGCSTKYGCCGGSGGPGCARKYPCCGALELEGNGCSHQYSCCSNATESIGCKKKYDCCGGHPEQSGGCQRQYICCEKLENEPGCILQCRKCKQKWGTLTSNCYRIPHRLVTPKH